MIIVNGIRLNETSYSTTTTQILTWAGEDLVRTIYAANVHMLMEAHDSPAFRDVVNNADFVVPDGMPLVWMMRIKGQKDQQRVYGPSLMLHVLESASREGIPVGFYGGKVEVLRILVEKMKTRYARLSVAYTFSPPFRELSLDEDAEIVNQINQSGARILFVGLGCPKQEMWMAEHRGKIKMVMLGVGAAFDFHAGVKSQSPAWMQRIGLEWLFRLITEPRRLWKRYLYHNPRFVVLALADLLGLLKLG